MTRILQRTELYGQHNQYAIEQVMHPLSKVGSSALSLVTDHKRVLHGLSRPGKKLHAVRYRSRTL